MTDEERWLDAEERTAWLTLLALCSVLPGAVEGQLQRDAGLTLFDYTVLAMLSERADRTLRMSDLAGLAHGSLSRLSHVARRLETRGYLTRAPLPEDGRVTVATVTDRGVAAIRAAAPAHVRHVRRLVLDPLTREQLTQLADAGSDLLVAIDPAAAERVQNARLGPG